MTVQYKRYRLAYPGDHGRTAYKVISFADTEFFNASVHAQMISDELGGTLELISKAEYDAELEQ